MKQIFVLLMAFSLILVYSCGNDNKVSAATTDENGNKTTTTVEVKDAKEAENEMDNMEKRMEELKKLQPYTLDQMKDLLPASIDGVKRSNYNAHSALGYAVISADYNKNDSTSLQISIYDCAGEAGASWYALNYWSKMNFQQESDKGYTKTIDLNGAKAVETWNSEGNYSSLSFIANDRLLIMLTGRNMKADELKAEAQNMSFKL